MKIILGLFKHEQQVLLESRKIILLRCQRKLKAEWQKIVSGVQSDWKSLLGALSRLLDFFLNPHARAHSGPVPETSRNLSRVKQGPLPEWSSSWSGCLCEPMYSGFKPIRGLLQKGFSKFVGSGSLNSVAESLFWGLSCFLTLAH